jgi:hypothetical protein
MLVCIHNLASQENDLNNNWLYVGVKTGINLALYDNDKSDNLRDNYAEIDNPNIDFIGSVQLFVPIFKYFGIQTEINFIKGEISERRKIKVVENGMDEYPGEFKTRVTINYFLIPILARFDYSYKIFQFTGLTGIYGTIPLQTVEFAEMRYNGNANSWGLGEVYNYIFRSTVGLMFGFDFGVKLGTGRIFLDMRYGFDFDDIDSKYETLFFLNINSLFRKIIPITIGYEIGIIKKKLTTTHYISPMAVHDSY